MLLFTVAFLFLFYFYFSWKAKYWQRKGVNGPKALPIIGNLWDNVILPQNEIEEKRWLKYGRVYGTMFGWKPAITIGEPQLLKQILITDFKVFMGHRLSFVGDPVMSKMLNELSGDEWRRMKAILSPAFSASKLRSMQPSIENCVRNTFKHFETVAANNSEVDLKKVALSFTLDTIAKCVFGFDTNGFENPNDPFIVIAEDFADIKVWRAASSLLLPSKLQIMFDMQLFRQSHLKYFKHILRDFIKQKRETETGRNDFLSLLINAEYTDNNNHNEMTLTVNEVHKQLSENEIMAQCIIFLIAGYETTATLLNYTLYVLATHANVQQKLFEEIRDYFDKHEQIEFDSLNALPYLDAVISESLRLYMPLTFIEHICGEDYELKDTGIFIEKGTLVNIPYYALHHDPEFYPNPHEFNAERFMPENRDKLVPYSYMPFGLGSRSCIGNRFSNLSSKIFLSKFVNTFEIIKTANTVNKPVFDAQFAFLTCKPLYATVKSR